ncbi:hypothetical protein GCM10028821_19860 [Hymenobacter jeollabukensis]
MAGGRLGFIAEEIGGTAGLRLRGLNGLFIALIAQEIKESHGCVLVEVWGKEVKNRMVNGSALLYADAAANVAA